jgi:hypothetical protein
MTHNPECGLDCVSAGAVRLDNTPSADQQTGRQHLSGDQSAEQAKHTPGPWRWTNEFRTRDNSITESLIGHEGYGIMSCDGLPNSPKRANARLIAASPQMLKALRRIALEAEAVASILEEVGESVTGCKKRAQWIADWSREAIAKAEGRDR